MNRNRMKIKYFLLFPVDIFFKVYSFKQFHRWQIDNLPGTIIKRKEWNNIAIGQWECAIYDIPILVSCSKIGDWVLILDIPYLFHNFISTYGSYPFYLISLVFFPFLQRLLCVSQSQILMTINHFLMKMHNGMRVLMWL